MTSPKELFAQNKELSDQVSAVVHTPWFAEWLMFGQAVMFDSKITTEELAGAAKFKDALLSLAEDPEVTRVPLGSGINYDLSIPVRTSFVHYGQPPVKP